MSLLAQIHLEDSYFLGFQAEASCLRLRVLFALAPGHPRYEVPLSEQQHCYRQGDSLIEEPQIIEAQVGARTPTVGKDPDGSLDLGFIDLSEQNGVYHVATEWFEMDLRAHAVSIEIA